MLREQIDILQDKLDNLELEVAELDEEIKAKKGTLKLIKDAKKKLETLEEQIGE